MRFVRPWTAVVVGLLVLVAVSQPVILARLRAQRGDARVDRYRSDLREVLPGVDRYATAGGTYEHFRGYARQPDGTESLVGLAFLASDLDTTTVGYSGPIDVLVGMDLEGWLTGVKVVEHQEPYGARSIDRQVYRDEFVHVHVRQTMHVGTEINAVSGATITVKAATNAIRRGARRMIRAYLEEQDASQP